MIVHLARFAGVLRGHGVDVGVGDAIDATRALGSRTETPMAPGASRLGGDGRAPASTRGSESGRIANSIPVAVRRLWHASPRTRSKSDSRSLRVNAG